MLRGAFAGIRVAGASVCLTQAGDEDVDDDRQNQQPENEARGQSFKKVHPGKPSLVE